MKTAKGSGGLTSRQMRRMCGTDTRELMKSIGSLALSFEGGELTKLVEKLPETITFKKSDFMKIAQDCEAFSRGEAMRAKEAIPEPLQEKESSPPDAPKGPALNIRSRSK